MDSNIVLEWAIDIASQSDNYRLHALANSHDRPILTEHILLVDRVFQDALHHFVVGLLLTISPNQIYRSTCQPNAIQLRQQVVEILWSNVKRNSDRDAAGPAHEVVVSLKHVALVFVGVLPGIASIPSELQRRHCNYADARLEIKARLLVHLGALEMRAWHATLFAVFGPPLRQFIQHPVGRLVEQIHAVSLLFRQRRYLPELYQFTGLVPDRLDRCVIVGHYAPDVVPVLRVMPVLFGTARI